MDVKFRKKNRGGKEADAIISFEKDDDHSASLSEEMDMREENIYGKTS